MEALQGRIQEIQGRIASLYPAPPAPIQTPQTLSFSGQSTGVGEALPARVRPFNIAFARACGQVDLRRMGSAVGPFPPEIEALATKYATQFGISPQLVRAVIQQESSGNPRSVSAVGAQGLMQLMPETARGLGVTDAFDPEQNISGGTRYLAGLLREWGNDIPKALAAYNAGPGAVRRANGVPNYPETQTYVRRIMGMLGER
jgi:soluble lytic murein transglycosylase-like protein